MKMYGNEYQDLAMRTNDHRASHRVHEKILRKSVTDSFDDNAPDPGDLLNGALGLTGEAGEVADIIKKYIFHGHKLDRDEIVKELGDVLWYVALLCETIGVSIEDVMTKNIDKLKNRYLDGFSVKASLNREE